MARGRAPGRTRTIIFASRKTDAQVAGGRASAHFPDHAGTRQEVAEQVQQATAGKEVN
jgi:hypothetical protein